MDEIFGKKPNIDPEAYFDSGEDFADQVGGSLDASFSIGGDNRGGCDGERAEAFCGNDRSGSESGGMDGEGEGDGSDGDLGYVGAVGGFSDGDDVGAVVDRGVAGGGCAAVSADGCGDEVGGNDGFILPGVDYRSDDEETIDLTAPVAER